MGYALRRYLSQHRWVYSLFVVMLAAIVASSVRSVVADAERARDIWTNTQIALVAAREHEAGELIEFDTVELPVVAIPDSALTALGGGQRARQSIAAG
ncbi:MAG: hypothetical protein AAFY28_13415, partial [Actinomycetota bacterium]